MPGTDEPSQAASDDDLLAVSKRIPDDNPAVRALKKFQQEMVGEAERAGIKSDDDVVALVMAERKNH